MLLRLGPHTSLAGLLAGLLMQHNKVAVVPWKPSGQEGLPSFQLGGGMSALSLRMVSDLQPGDVTRFTFGYGERGLRWPPHSQSLTPAESMSQD